MKTNRSTRTIMIVVIIMAMLTVFVPLTNAQALPVRYDAKVTLGTTEMTLTILPDSNVIMAQNVGGTSITDAKVEASYNFSGVGDQNIATLPSFAPTNLTSATSITVGTTVWSGVLATLPNQHAIAWTLPDVCVATQYDFTVTLGTNVVKFTMLPGSNVMMARNESGADVTDAKVEGNFNIGGVADQLISALPVYNPTNLTAATTAVVGSATSWTGVLPTLPNQHAIVWSLPVLCGSAATPIAAQAVVTATPGAAIVATPAIVPTLPVLGITPGTDRCQAQRIDGANSRLVRAGCVVSGDVKVNNVIKYDNDGSTGLVITLTADATISGEWGFSVWPDGTAATTVVAALRANGCGSVCSSVANITAP